MAQPFQWVKRPKYFGITTYRGAETATFVLKVWVCLKDLPRWDSWSQVLTKRNPEQVGEFHWIELFKTNQLNSIWCSCLLKVLCQWAYPQKKRIRQVIYEFHNFVSNALSILSGPYQLG
jgi:hypothetical protein